MPVRPLLCLFSNVPVQTLVFFRLSFDNIVKSDLYLSRTWCSGLATTTFPSERYIVDDWLTDDFHSFVSFIKIHKPISNTIQWLCVSRAPRSNESRCIQLTSWISERKSDLTSGVRFLCINRPDFWRRISIHKSN